MRTLKDIKLDVNNVKMWYFNEYDYDLKEVAREWIKDLETKNYRDSKYDIINFIKHFFNLKDE